MYKLGCEALKVRDDDNLEEANLFVALLLQIYPISCTTFTEMGYKAEHSARSAFHSALKLEPNTQNWNSWPGIFRVWFMALLVASLDSAASGLTSTWHLALGKILQDSHQTN